MNTSLLISGLHENALQEEEHARLSQKLDFKILVYILAHCVYVVILVELLSRKSYQD